MPLQRKMTHIPALDSVCQLLAELQLGGHLDGVELPGWAIGTSVEEVFKAVRYIDDAEWLDGVYDGYGPQESADRWLEAFLNGKEVPDIDDAKRLAAGDEDAGGDEPSLRKSLDEFLSGLSKRAATHFSKRLEQEDGFEAAAINNLNAIGLALAASFGADDEQFASVEAEFTFLDPATASDPQLAQMSKHFLIENYEEFLDRMGADGAARARAVKRIKALAAKLKKAIKATA